MDIVPEKMVAAAEADETKTISYFKTRIVATAIGAGVAGVIVGALLVHFF